MSDQERLEQLIDKVKNYSSEELKRLIAILEAVEKYLQSKNQ